MTQTGYANAIVNAMLGWLKGLASWVLRLFNLSGGFSPLKFLADNWLKLLIVLLVVGVAMDLLVWLIRWRPHWVWFRKKRVIINDKNFFAGEKYIDSPEDLERPPVRRRSGCHCTASMGSAVWHIPSITPSPAHCRTDSPAPSRWTA